MCVMEEFEIYKACYIYSLLDSQLLKYKINMLLFFFLLFLYIYMFTRRNIKEELLNKRRVKCNLITHDISFLDRPAESVYINESLSPARHRVFNTTWAIEGKGLWVFVGAEWESAALYSGRRWGWGNNPYNDRSCGWPGKITANQQNYVNTVYCFFVFFNLLV